MKSHGSNRNGIPFLGPNTSQRQGVLSQYKSHSSDHRLGFPIHLTSKEVRKERVREELNAELEYWDANFNSRSETCWMCRSRKNAKPGGLCYKCNEKG